jgi:hypothetical protein
VKIGDAGMIPSGVTTVELLPPDIEGWRIEVDGGCLRSSDSIHVNCLVIFV